MAIVLTGTAVTFDAAPEVVTDGAVYINEGVIDAVQPRRRAAPAGYSKARRVTTGGNIYPGLIDLHSHLAYNFLPLWSAPRETPYTSRHQWPGAATYGRDISNPAQAMGIAAAAAALRYAEVKAAAGGVTSIQGSPPLTRAFPGWMVRNVEKQTFAESNDTQLVYQAVIKADVAKLRTYAARLAEGRSFVYHLAEGTDPDLPRGVPRPAHRRVCPCAAHRHPLHGPRARRVRRMGRQPRRSGVVAVLEHLALRRHDRRARSAPPRAASCASGPTGPRRAPRTCWEN